MGEEGTSYEVLIIICTCFCINLMIGLQEDESKHLMHLSLGRHLDAVKWNPLNQDEV